MSLRPPSTALLKRSHAAYIACLFQSRPATGPTQRVSHTVPSFAVGGAARRPKYVWVFALLGRQLDRISEAPTSDVERRGKGQADEQGGGRRGARRSRRGAPEEGRQGRGEGRGAVVGEGWCEGRGEGRDAVVGVDEDKAGKEEGRSETQS